MNDFLTVDESRVAVAAAALQGDVAEEARVHERVRASGHAWVIEEQRLGISSALQCGESPEELLAALALPAPWVAAQPA